MKTESRTRQQERIEDAPFSSMVLVMSTVWCATTLRPNAMPVEMKLKQKVESISHPNGLCQARGWNTMSLKTCEADCQIK